MGVWEEVRFLVYEQFVSLVSYGVREALQCKSISEGGPKAQSIVINEKSTSRSMTGASWWIIMKGEILVRDERRLTFGPVRGSPMVDEDGLVLFYCNSSFYSRKITRCQRLQMERDTEWFLKLKKQIEHDVGTREGKCGRLSFVPWEKWADARQTVNLVASTRRRPFHILQTHDQKPIRIHQSAQRNIMKLRSQVYNLTSF